MKTTQLSLLISLLAATFFAAGCFEEEDSCNIRTPGIYVEFSVTEQGSKADAVATFWTGDDPGGTYLELGACGDSISVNGTKLSETGTNPTRYKATIDISDGYDFDFERPDEGSYSSTVYLVPEPVTILTPSGDEFARDESFDVTWENNGSDQIKLKISSDCFWDYPNTNGDAVTDNGSHTVPEDAFDIKDGEKGETCTAEVQLTRSEDGVLSEDLKGTIVGRTRDTSSFTSTPAADE